MTKLQKTLTKHLVSQDALGQGLLALSSVLSFPDEYMLGKKAIHMSCMYGHTPKCLAEAEYLATTGSCLACESIQEFNTKHPEAFTYEEEL